MSNKANDTQVGGSHYQTSSKMQHWDAVYDIFGGDYLIGNSTKYLARLGKKGGPEKAIEDLKKAIHYLEKKLEIMESEMKSYQEDMEQEDISVTAQRHYDNCFNSIPPVAMPAGYGYVPPKPTTLGDIIQKAMRDEGLDSGVATSRYTKQG